MTVLGSEFDIDPRCDRRDESGPFDIIGDVHGCTDELIALMTELGYRVSLGDWAAGKPVDITPRAVAASSSSATSPIEVHVPRIRCDSS